MARDSYPGLDKNGFQDGGSIALKSFNTDAERDAWVASQSIGGTVNLPMGFICYLVTPATLTVWNSALGAWRTIATT